LIGGKGLGFFGRNSGLFGDNSSHDTTDSLNTKTQRSRIDKDHVSFGLTTENTTLDGSTISDSLIWVNTGIWEFSVEEIFDHLLDLWDSSGTTDKDDLIDITLFETCVIKCSLDRGHGSLEEITIQLFKSSSGENFREINSVEEILDFDSDFMSG